MRHNRSIVNAPSITPDQTEQPHPRLAAAVDLARSAALIDAAEVDPRDTDGADVVGAHVAVQSDGTAAATHFFEANYPGYRGWRWAVTVAAADDDSDDPAPVTVSEVVLLPGPDALVAPEWVPWDQRVRAGDLGVGDLLPASADDPRLVPGYLESDDPVVEGEVREIGLGRPRVLSREGRLDAAQRWRDERGPSTDMAVSAPSSCGTCGFYLPLAGSLSAAFGVCGNEFSPADGRAVHVEFGCGAHSEVEAEPLPLVPVAEVIYDDAQLDLMEPAVVDRRTPSAASASETDAADAASGAASGVADAAASVEPGATTERDRVTEPSDG